MVYKKDYVYKKSKVKSS